MASRRRLRLAALCGLLAGCNDLVGIHEPHDRLPPTCDAAAPFGPATLVTALDVSYANDEGARLTLDELTVYFHSDRAGTRDLFMARRARRDDSFGVPELLAVSSAARESWPTLTADGLKLYFEVADDSAIQIYVSTRATAAAAFVERSLVALSTTPWNAQPFVLPNGQAILYGGAVSSWDLYRAERGAGSEFGPAALIPNVNTGDNEFVPVPSADDLALYFASGRPDGGARGGDDIWVARRASPTANYGPPVNVQELNTGYDELPSWISPDGCRLYFHRSEPDDARIYVAEKVR
jgi:hypothetical protein